jgi:membrane associated rhomboid family serine protease
MVKLLLIINLAVFLVSISVEPLGRVINFTFRIDPKTLGRALQIWRLITYQFLHGDVLHILFNMLGLYFLGPSLERHWGGRKFVIFYLLCGVAGGLFYLLLVAVKFLSPLPMVGASGAILGMLAACAILFPQFVVFILFFPVPIRLAAVIFTFIFFVFVVTKGDNAGGHAAHLAGMAAGAGYVLSGSWRQGIKLKLKKGAWQKKVQSEEELQIELDRILEKIHQSGIHSLTSREKKILKKATDAEKTRNRY